MQPSREKTTNAIRLIAQDAIGQQAQVCEARRENLEDKLGTLTETVSILAESIAELTRTVAVLATTVAPLDVISKEHTDALSKLKGRPAIWAAIGAASPILLGVLLWWLSSLSNR